MYLNAHFCVRMCGDSTVNHIEAQIFMSLLLGVKKVSCCAFPSVMLFRELWEYVCWSLQDNVINYINVAVLIYYDY